MQERSTEPGAPSAHMPLGATSPAPVANTTVDKFPKSPAEWAAFVALPAPERSAVYLRSIRAMMLFFTVLTILGIIATVVLFLIGIHAVNQSNTTTTNPFG